MNKDEIIKIVKSKQYYNKLPRDINRIEPFLKELEALWKLNPDIRFGQLVYWMTNEVNLFNIEDDKLLEIIQKSLHVQKGV